MNAAIAALNLMNMMQQQKWLQAQQTRKTILDKKISRIDGRSYAITKQEYDLADVAPCPVCYNGAPVIEKQFHSTGDCVFMVKCTSCNQESVLHKLP